MLTFKDVSFKALFRIAREKAVRSGDREAVTTLGQCFVRSNDLNDIPRSEIFGQLENEYGFDVKSAVEERDRKSVIENSGLSVLEIQVQKSRGFFSNPEHMGDLGDFEQTAKEIHTWNASILRGE